MYTISHGVLPMRKKPRLLRAFVLETSAGQHERLGLAFYTDVGDLQEHLEYPLI